MNISFNNRDAASGILKIEVTKEDYAAEVEKGLRDFRRKADIPGFRKGMAPMGMLSKMYGKQMLAEKIDYLVSNNLSDYISKNLNILGEPLPNETEQKEIDFETQEDFEFYFDLALAPEINIELSKADVLPCYQVVVDDDLVNNRIESYRVTFGTYDADAEAVAEKDVVKGIATELEDGVPREGGIVVEDAILMPMYLKNEEDRQKFIGAKKGDTLTFNPQRAYEGSEAEIASFLKTDKTQVLDITADFNFEIKEITHYKEAELNQELYDKIFGEGVVADEAAFNEKVKESISKQYAVQSNYKFHNDVRTLLLDKAHDMVFAEDILKRWMCQREENKTEEQVNEEYPKIAEDLKFHLIKEHIIKNNNLLVENEEVDAMARKIVKSQFAQYGMPFVDDDLVSDYAKNLLKETNTLCNVIDRVTDDKLVDWLKNNISLDVKNVSAEEFVKILQIG
jgi:trigger factor